MLSDSYLHILQDSKIFNGLDEKHLKTIINYGSKQTFNANESIITEGQTEHPLYIILEGEVEIFLPQKRQGAIPERATRIKLKRLIKGDCIGEYSLIDNKPASASAVALNACDTFHILRSDFKNLIMSSDHLAKSIYKNMLLVIIQRCRDSDDELDMCNICY
jgi:CRP/FNR family cyclic AMP-dependent transcriptional regulator